MSEHLFLLEKYSGRQSRHACPACGKRDVFAWYINRETNEILNDAVGRCNREDKCGYHYTPSQFFQDNPNFKDNFKAAKIIRVASRHQVPPQKSNSFSCMELGIFKASLKHHDRNQFCIYLAALLGVERARAAISNYFVGTSSHWPGSTVFWQIDGSGRARTGKIMLYSPDTGKRVKEPFNHITWVHKLAADKDFELRQCFFGEHLLKLDKQKPVAICESEKTAIIAQAYLPDFIWLAAGGLSNLSIEKCAVLKDRNVCLFPDLNGFEKWSKRADELKIVTRFVVSDLLERKATDEQRAAGWDLADYLEQFNVEEFLQQSDQLQAASPPIAALPTLENSADAAAAAAAPDDLVIEQANTIFKKNFLPWDITELEAYCESLLLMPELLPRSFRLNKYTICTDLPLMIRSHLDVIIANNGNPTYLSYLERLYEIKEVILKMRETIMPASGNEY